jgi:hypothetical protein
MSEHLHESAYESCFESFEFTSNILAATAAKSTSEAAATKSVELIFTLF